MDLTLIIASDVGHAVRFLTFFIKTAQCSLFSEPPTLPNLGNCKHWDSVDLLPNVASQSATRNGLIKTIKKTPNEMNLITK